MLGDLIRQHSLHRLLWEPGIAEAYTTFRISSIESDESRAVANILHFSSYTSAYFVERL